MEDHPQPTQPKQTSDDNDIFLKPFELGATVSLYRDPQSNRWQSAEPQVEEQAEPEPTPASVGNAEPPEKGGWMISLLCIGIALIAICLLLPMANENHELAYQKQKLSIDLEQIKKQLDVNNEFLTKVADDPTLAERLAERQMKFVREGTDVLDLPEQGQPQSSPFMLVALPPPNPMPPYQPLGGTLAIVGRNPHLRMMILGIGLLLAAAGIVLDGGNKQTHDDIDPA
jgi:hypothetical protein